MILTLLGIELEFDGLRVIVTRAIDFPKFSMFHYYLFT